MTKKTFIVLICLLFTEFLAILTFASSFGVWQTQTAQDQSLKSPEIVYRQAKNFEPPKELTLYSAKQTWILNKTKLETFKPLRTTLSENSPDHLLANYFVKAAGTALPLTNTQNSSTLLDLELNEKALGEYLLTLAQEVNRPPQDAELLIEGGRATEFVPHQDGARLDLRATRKLFKEAVLKSIETLTLPILESKPKTRLGDLNALGIKELLATGGSDFSGSSTSRIQNIKVGSSQYNGLIIPPGEEFSFNENIGKIDAAHGYLPELVIKREGTVPEFGGGLCQVSSTAFRAAFFAGLPITQRRNHSYAVRYYEWINDDAPRAVGLDATIYPGAQDMKFINDTPGYILVWTRVEGKRLYFDFYGTPDGRKVIVDGPHPYDKKSDGSVKSKVTRTVISPRGEPIEVTFNSRYVSPNLYPRTYEYPKTPTPPPSETPPSPPPATN